MDWESCWLAIRELDPDASLGYKDNDGWYVASSILITDGPLTDNIRIFPALGGYGQTPTEAIERYWRTLVTELAPGRYVHATSNDPRHLRWENGHWADQLLPAVPSRH